MMFLVFLSDISEDHSSVLNEIVTHSSLDNGINPGVESSKELESISNFTFSFGVAVEVSSFLLEEIGSETFVGVTEDFIDIVVVLGRNIFAEELNLIDHISTFRSFSGGCFLG